MPIDRRGGDIYAGTPHSRRTGKQEYISDMFTRKSLSLGRSAVPSFRRNIIQTYMAFVFLSSSYFFATLYSSFRYRFTGPFRPFLSASSFLFGIFIFVVWNLIRRGASIFSLSRRHICGDPQF